MAAAPKAENDGLLIAFGDLTSSSGVAKAEKVYQALMSRGYWLAARVPKTWSSGLPVLFYQAGFGFRGWARLLYVSITDAADAAVIGQSAKSFPLKLVLTDVEVFPEPLDMRPLVPDLAFVTVKQHWGQALRFTPRMIPAKDVNYIVQQAGGKSAQPRAVMQPR